jgi:hypothetical protein
MYDGGKVIVGLILGLGIIAFPFWYNLAQGGPAYEKPELQYPPESKATECIRETEWMAAEHMQLLDDWRDQTVREGQRIYHAPDGKAYVASLQNTCMECHETKEKFCDRCHDAASVSPYCWDCHIAPQEKEGN